MKTRLPVLSLVALAAAIGAAPVFASSPAPAAEEKKSPTITRSITVTRSDSAPKEKEKVTYLGVETGPVPRALAAHLGLDPELGLVVNGVAADSPAALVIQENDVLKKLDDQILVDSRQLSVLIRARKPGDEVKLTLVRAGREQVVTAKLGEREKQLGQAIRLMNWADRGGRSIDLSDRAGQVFERLRDIPGLGREEMNDVFRIIGREGGPLGAGPRVHVWSRRGDGSTILNLREGNFTFSDEAGSIEVNASGGERQLKVKDPSGKVTFEGPVNTEEQRAALPEDVKARLKKLDTVTIDFQGAEPVRPGAAAPAEKTRHHRVELRPAAPGARPI